MNKRDDSTRDLSETRKAMKSRKNVQRDRKSTRLNSSHSQISYAVSCLEKKKLLQLQLLRAVARGKAVDVSHHPGGAHRRVAEPLRLGRRASPPVAMAPVQDAVYRGRRA